jgi:hypothetical protein
MVGLVDDLAALSPSMGLRSVIGALVAGAVSVGVFGAIGSFRVSGAIGLFSASCNLTV